jgi:hypothetical protein
MIHKFCDGSKIKFKPKYQTTSECYECGHITKIKPILINKPDFHKGPFEKDKCLACEKESFEISVIQMFKVIEKNCMESVIKDFERTNKFFEALEKK